MTRREFITLLGAAAAWPLTARAQQPAMPVIGFLHSASPGPYAHLLAAFREGLRETGYVEGKNVAIEYRWAEGRYDRLPALAAELVRLNVALIAAAGGEPSPLAAKAATSTIPIVFTAGGDPVEAGLVASLGLPGGNITGTTIMGLQMGPKRLDIVKQLVPTAGNITMLVNPKFPTVPGEVRDMQEAARALGIEVTVLNASTEGEIEIAFRTMVQQRTDALIIATDPFLLARREQLVALTSYIRVPTIYFLREFVDAGGLISYGPSIASGYRQSGRYAGQILTGANPGTLPVMQPTHFLLFLNLRAAKALGLTIPDKLLALADEVIE
jgi:putative tryptophan/tyrosine transport system substrate-binding protein